MGILDPILDSGFTPDDQKWYVDDDVLGFEPIPEEPNLPIDGAAWTQDAGCEHAPPPSLPDTLRWTADRVAVAFFGPYVRPPAEYPYAGEVPPDMWRPGSAELLSANPVRMVPTTDIRPYGEACAQHRARWTLDERGYAVAVAGNLVDDEGLPLNVFARAWVANQASVDEVGGEILREGYAYWVGGYRTPPWVEAIFTAPAVRCGGFIA